MFCTKCSRIQEVIKIHEDNSNKLILPNKEMLDGIIFSVKPKYNKLIIEKKKRFEYRNYVPKDFNGYFWVYETLPSKCLKYLMKVEYPIAFPNKLDGDSYGTSRFNSGEMGSKYAYEIKEVYLLKESLDLDYLKVGFEFIPPQAFTYLNNNKELKKFISSKIKLERII